MRRFRDSTSTFKKVRPHLFYPLVTAREMDASPQLLNPDVAHLSHFSTFRASDYSKAETKVLGQGLLCRLARGRSADYRHCSACRVKIIAKDPSQEMGRTLSHCTTPELCIRIALLLACSYIRDELHAFLCEFSAESLLQSLDALVCEFDRSIGRFDLQRKGMRDVLG
jgi:hypothetical protein